MNKQLLSVEQFRKPREIQDIDAFDISGSELLSILSMFDPYGIWRFDLKSGQVFWTPDVFRIHEMEYVEGPIDMVAAMKAYHPEDQKTVATLISDAIEKKSGYRYVLRLRRPDGTYKLVKSICKYRVSAERKEELIGVFSQFALPIRSVAVAG